METIYVKLHPLQDKYANYPLYGPGQVTIAIKDV